MSGFKVYVYDIHRDEDRVWWDEIRAKWSNGTKKEIALIVGFGWENHGVPLVLLSHSPHRLSYWSKWKIASHLSHAAMTYNTKYSYYCRKCFYFKLWLSKFQPCCLMQEIRCFGLDHTKDETLLGVLASSSSSIFTKPWQVLPWAQFYSFAFVKLIFTILAAFILNANSPAFQVVYACWQHILAFTRMISEN